MPSVIVPPEIWSRVFFFVAPPLPFVGMENESFAEDAKEWRGDHSVKGQWRDIDNLMLVSKTMNALVSPVFWSYLVLASSWRAKRLIACMSSPSRPSGSLPFGLVKVVRICDARDSEPWEEDTTEHPILGVLRRATHAVHLHLELVDPTPVSLLVLLAAREKKTAHLLEGFTGLVLAPRNFEAAMVALRQLSPHLRRLLIASHKSRFGPPELMYTSNNACIHFPQLVDIAAGTLYDGDSGWLDDHLLGYRWQLHFLKKIALSPPQADGVLNEPPLWWYHEQLRVPLNAVFLKELNDLQVEFKRLADTEARELAFGISGRHAPVNLVRFKLELDEANDGVCRSVEVVVVVEGKVARRPSSGLDLCLAELVNRRRFPSLEKVVWVAALKDNKDLNWSTTLVKWILALKDSGVKFEIQ